MRGATGTQVLLVMGFFLVALVLAYQVFVQPKVQVTIPAQPTPQPTPEVEKVPVTQWDLLVVLADEEGKPVYDANIWLLYEKPSNIYATPTTNIYRAATDVNESYTFTNIRTGEQYFILAAAPGFYNAGIDFNMPSEIDKTMADLKQPVTAEITMSHKGTILGVQVPLTYRGSSADIAKLVYNADTDDYETEFQWVVDSSGEVRYKEIRVDLNTDALTWFNADLNTNVTATIDKVIVKIGDQEFDISDISTSKVIEFDEEQVIPKASTLTVHMYVDGVDLQGVSGPLFTLTLYDVQEGEYTATVEGPA